MNGLVCLLTALIIAWGTAETVAPGITDHVLTAYQRVMAAPRLPDHIDSAMLPLMPTRP